MENPDTRLLSLRQSMDRLQSVFPRRPVLWGAAPAAIQVVTTKKFIELRIPDQVYEYQTQSFLPSFINVP